MSAVVSPNLTEHFKQALNMTRNQFQSGSTPLNSATQMGVQQSNSATQMGVQQSNSFGVGGLNSTNFNNGKSLNITDGMTENLNGDGIKPTNFFVDFYNKYNKVILISIVIVVCFYIGYKYWWHPRYGDSVSVEQITNGISSNTSQRQHDRIKRQNYYSNLTQPQQQQLPQQQQQQQPQQQLPQQQSQQQLPQQQSQQQLQQPSDDNIRLNEQQMAMRGAEFSNPQFVSHIMPVSTRLPQQQQQQVSIPQQVVSPQQQPQQPQQVVSPQQMSIPPPQQMSIPPPQINIMELPVSTNDKVQPQNNNQNSNFIQALPISDPNYTPI